MLGHNLSGQVSSQGKRAGSGPALAPGNALGDTWIARNLVHPYVGRHVDPLGDFVGAILAPILFRPLVSRSYHNERIGTFGNTMETTHTYGEGSLCHMAQNAKGRVPHTTLLLQCYVAGHHHHWQQLDCRSQCPQAAICGRKVRA